MQARSHGAGLLLFPGDSECGVIEALHRFGWLTDDEYGGLKANLEDGLSNLEGERVNLLFSDASWDYGSLIPMMETALDKGADVFVTETTPVAQAAVNFTLAMDDPIPVIFMSVFNPYAAGIADAPCIKPDNVTGTQELIDYEGLLALAALQNPDLETVGTLYNSASAAGQMGAELIAEAGEALGIRVEQAAVFGLADVGIGLEGLISKGVDAFVLTVDILTSQATAQIATIGADNDIPVYHPVASYLYSGATVAAGSIATYGPGLNAGQILVGILDGALDPATTGINTADNSVIAVNVDRSARSGVKVSENLLSRADFVVADGELSITPKGMTNFQFLGEMGMMALLYPQLASGTDAVTPEMLAMLAQVAFPDPTAAHEAFLAGLQCTDEMIAEQQAELDAG